MPTSAAARHITAGSPSGSAAPSSSSSGSAQVGPAPHSVWTGTVERTGQDVAHERRKSFAHRFIRPATPVITRDDGSAAVLCGLDRRFAIGGEPVVGRLVHPDPDWEQIRYRTPKAG